MKAVLLLSILVPASAQALESPVLKEAGVSVRPVVTDGKRLLVPVREKETQPSPAFLLGDDLKPLPLKAIGKTPVKADVHAGELPYWAFEPPMQESKRSSAFLVLVGEKAPSVAHFYSLYRAGHESVIPDCLGAEKGFAHDRVNVFGFKLPNGERTIGYTTSKILRSAYDKMTDEEKAGGTVMRKRLAVVEEKGRCQTLAEEADNGDGIAVRNGATPIGPVIGLLALESGGKSETWLAARGEGYEEWGTTLIKLPAKPGEKIEREFLYEYGH